ncbi:DUF418 domain-containing protein [Verrucomicrobium sp. BvORR106]|uniref:DUF418 domain-containing protein n=1 Tax=Verrucomicrobium sp. BvORR106 TaxID=1403819 RepID=UPI000690D55D|nr:DUF418 domain-containing protein [Verrucomicrobium sp. BvORR106]
MLPSQLRQALPPVPLPPHRQVSTRIEELDALRGLALAGILLVNIMAFASPYYGSGVIDPQFADVWSQGARWLVALLFETKFYLWFAFLFGYSFTLQSDSLERSDKAVAPALLRRMAALLIIGVLHGTLLFPGDILTLYALCGVILICLRNVADRTALRTAGWLVAITAFLWAAVGMLLLAAEEVTDAATVHAEAQAALNAWQGSATSVLARRLQEWSTTWAGLFLIQGPTSLAMFLLGMVAGRHHLLRRRAASELFWWKIVRQGVVIALPCAALYATSTVMAGGTGWEILGLAFGLLTAPFLTGTFIFASMTAMGSRWDQRIMDCLAPAGSMALSNHLLQSAVCAWLFTGYGLGLMGKVSPLQAAALAVSIYLAQLALSIAWRNRFRQGPMEMVLRAITYLEWKVRKG